ncbi:MAG: DUF4912 domain-containing protein [Candidatus Omnitrophota bacterium]|nr:DUF4912 domain-containing protein [Candidatus Omnitrophota bacterium]
MMILRKLKEKLKKLTQRKAKPKEAKVKEIKPKARILKKIKTIKEPVHAETKKAALNEEQLIIEREKYSHPQITKPRRVLPQELPTCYDQDKIVLQVRDLWWLHAYWEVKGSTIERLKNEFKDEFYKARRVLRVYDITNTAFNGSNAQRFFDVPVSDYSSNWYIDTGGPGKSWIVDFGLLLSDGRFITIIRSNIVYTPQEGPSLVTDEEWMVPEEMFARLYGMGFGLGRSSPTGKAWQERIKQALFSGVFASPGMASMASPVKKLPRERKFWFVLDCELIVYGATEPDAKVTVQGRPITLRQDGTFSLRFSLPDGKQVIPVKAVSSDSIEERVIMPTVTRETKSSIMVKEEIANL